MMVTDIALGVFLGMIAYTVFANIIMLIIGGTNE